MKKFVIIAIVLMAAASCTNKTNGVKVIHYPVEWDSSSYIPRPMNDSLIETRFLWSTGEETPTITTPDSGEYELTYTKVYASGVVSSVRMVFIAGPGTVIDPIVNVFYLWSTGETSSSIEITEPGNYVREEVYIYASGVHSNRSIIFKLRDNLEYEVVYCPPFEYNPGDMSYEVIEWDPSTCEIIPIDSVFGTVYSYSMFDSGYLIKGEICK